MDGTSAMLGNGETASSSGRPTAEVELHDPFAISHYDRRQAPQRTNKHFLDAVTIGHVLNKARNVARGGGERRSAAQDMLNKSEHEFEITLQAMTAKLEQLRQLCARDPLVGELPAPGSTTRVPVQWNDRRYWLLVRMTVVLDEGNRRLGLLLQRGALTKNEMKRQQRELARPYRAALQGVVDRAASLENMVPNA